MGSAAAAAAAQPYVGWLAKTAAAPSRPRAQARLRRRPMRRRSRGCAPAVDRCQPVALAALVATNFLGINTPAIVAAEAQYAEMWVQDAVTLTTTRPPRRLPRSLQPLTPASPTTSPAAAATQSAAVAQEPPPPARRRVCRVSWGEDVAGNGASSIGTGLFNLLPAPVQTPERADGFSWHLAHLRRGRGGWCHGGLVVGTPSRPRWSLGHTLGRHRGAGRCREAS